MNSLGEISFFFLVKHAYSGSNGPLEPVTNVAFKCNDASGKGNRVLNESLISDLD